MPAIKMLPGRKMDASIADQVFGWQDVGWDCNTVLHPESQECEQLPANSSNAAAQAQCPKQSAGLL